MVRIVPNRLKEARIIRRYTITELAMKLSISKQAVSKYETGKSQPSPEILMKIVDILKVPVNFLTKENMNNLEFEENSLCFRTASKTKLAEIEYARIKLKWAVETSNGLFSCIDENILPDFPDFSNCSKIEEKALLLRKHWGLGLEPIENLTAIVEQNGILVFNLNNEEISIDAYSQWIGQQAYIVVNSLKGTAVRWRFNIAHELGHLVLHKNIKKRDVLCVGKSELFEKEANEFASIFLMPSDSFRLDFISDKLSYFIDLKRKWGISISAIIYKAGELQLISDKKRDSLNRQLSSKGWRKREPLDDEILYERPILLKQKLMSVVSDYASAENLVENLRMSHTDIEEICLVENSFFENIGFHQFERKNIYEYSVEPFQLSIFD